MRDVKIVIIEEYYFDGCIGVIFVCDNRGKGRNEKTFLDINAFHPFPVFQCTILEVNLEYPLAVVS